MNEHDADGLLVEIKSPLGNSRKTMVREQFERAAGQWDGLSRELIIVEAKK